MTREHMYGRYVPYGAVKAHVVVHIDEIGHNTPGLIQAQGRFGPDTLLFQ